MTNFLIVKQRIILFVSMRVSRLGTPVGTALNAGGVHSGGGAGTHGHADLHPGARAQGDAWGQRGVLRERLTRANIIHLFFSIVNIVITIVLSIIFTIVLSFIFITVLSFISITVFAIVFAIVSSTAYLGCSDV